jgi:hypothetical protein
VLHVSNHHWSRRQSIFYEASCVIFIARIFVGEFEHDHNNCCRGGYFSQMGFNFAVTLWS